MRTRVRVLHDTPFFDIISRMGRAKRHVREKKATLANFQPVLDVLDGAGYPYEITKHKRDFIVANVKLMEGCAVTMADGWGMYASNREQVPNRLKTEIVEVSLRCFNETIEICQDGYNKGYLPVSELLSFINEVVVPKATAEVLRRIHKL